MSAPGLPPPPPEGSHPLPIGTFDGQVVLVTGGGTGLGRAIAVEFARLGATVAIASRSAEHRAAGAAAVEAVGARAVTVGCDVRDPEAVAARTHGPVGRGSSTRPPRRPASTTSPARSRWSGPPTASGSTGWCPA